MSRNAFKRARPVLAIKRLTDDRSLPSGQRGNPILTVLGAESRGIARALKLGAARSSCARQEVDRCGFIGFDLLTR